MLRMLTGLKCPTKVPVAWAVAHAGAFSSGKRGLKPTRLRLLSVTSGLWIALASLTSLARCAEPPRVVSATAAPDWDQRFQRTSGWIGADGNYSVQVAPDRLLWFYSDTLIGRVENGRRVDSKLINNSVGVQTPTLAGQQLEFFHGTDAQGQPAALFIPDDPKHWFWLLGGTCIDAKVHLFLWEFEKSSDPGVFGFVNVGVSHAVIDNPLDPPTTWKVTRRPLPFTELTKERRVIFGSAVLQHGDYVYVYGVRETPQVHLSPRKMLLARVPVASVSDPSRWEFRTASGWSQDFHEAAPIASGLSSEYSVSPLPALGQFISISHGDLLSPMINARFADQPWGPWSEPVGIWTCPEPAGKKGYFAYAGKAHPALSTGDDLLITYAVNSFQFGDLFSDASLYWPRFVRVKLAKRMPE